MNEAQEAKKQEETALPAPEAAEKEILQEDVPDHFMEVQAPAPPEPKRATFFEAIAVPDWVETTLRKVSLASMVQAFHHAKVCRGPS